MSCWQFLFYSSLFHLNHTVVAMLVVTGAILKGLAVTMRICMTNLFFFHFQISVNTVFFFLGGGGCCLSMGTNKICRDHFG